MQLLVDATRRADCNGARLADAHRAVGRALASSVADLLVLEPVQILHVAGRSTGIRIAPGSEPVILTLMRAGLFVAEGVWEQLEGAALVPVAHGAAQWEQSPLEGRPVIVIDAVVNSGKSIEVLLDVLQHRKPSSVTVMALVANRVGIEALAVRWPEVRFVAARLSDRSYVGRGGTDTGARLFGTTQWPSEQ